jgi:hypothetical protein
VITDRGSRVNLIFEEPWITRITHAQSQSRPALLMPTLISVQLLLESINAYEKDFNFRLPIISMV